MAYLDPKGEGDHSMPGKQRPGSSAETTRCGTRTIWLRLDCLNPNLQGRNDPPAGKALGTGVTPCIGIPILPIQPPGCVPMSSEDIRGDEWGA
jgi:hypothetical protein